MSQPINTQHIVKISTSSPQQKPLLTNTQSPLKERKSYKNKIRIYYKNLEYRKSVHTLFLL